MSDGEKKFDLNAILNQVKALGRGGIWFGAGFLVAKGKLDFEDAVTYVGLVLTILGGGATVVAHTNSSIVSAASQVPEMKEMGIADQKLAQVAKDADPETKVKVMAS